MLVENNIQAPFKKVNDNARALVQRVLKGDEVEIEVTLQEDLQDGGYFVTINPNLPIYTDGETIDETKFNFQEAFELFFEEIGSDISQELDLTKFKIIYYQKILL